MIKFNQPAILGTELSYIKDAMHLGHISGSGYFTKKCEAWFEKYLGVRKTLMTSSCTHALEIAALLLNIEPGDEVIMPSYTFVSSANPFVMRGAKIVFVDIDPKTMNIDVNKLPSAINSRSKAIVPVHYAGHPCDMEPIVELAHKYDLMIVEDAAQAIGVEYNGRPLGTIGNIGCMSFHETKNITSGGEGGLLILNDPDLIKRAEVIREKGTDRSAFFRNEVDKYTWRDIGSSYLASELQAAYLWGQIEQIDNIINRRKEIWNRYHHRLEKIEQIPNSRRPSKQLMNNAHIFYLKCINGDDRHQLIEHLKNSGIMAVSHYIPLHSSIAGKRFGRFQGEDEYTTLESERLLRLPLWFNMNDQMVDLVSDSVLSYYLK